MKKHFSKRIHRLQEYADSARVALDLSFLQAAAESGDAQGFAKIEHDIYSRLVTLVMSVPPETVGPGAERFRRRLRRASKERTS